MAFSTVQRIEIAVPYRVTPYNDDLYAWLLGRFGQVTRNDVGRRWELFTAWHAADGADLAALKTALLSWRALITDWEEGVDKIYISYSDVQADVYDETT